MLWERNNVIEETKFEGLNDDCCREILRRLPLDDLCALSRTCTRLYNLCSEQFALQYKSKFVYIKGVHGKLIMEPSNEEYVKCFAKSVQNVVLCRGVASNLDAVQAFYSQSGSKEGENAAVNVKQIFFQNCTLTERRGTAIADILKTVESIQLCNVETVDDDLYDCILKHTAILKSLKLQWISENGTECSCENKGAARNDWLQKTYPNLESLEWNADHPLLQPKPELIKAFLQLNPNVTKFTLYTNRTETINTFLAHDVQIDELYFNMADIKQPEHAQLGNQTINALKQLCEKHKTKFHLVFMSADSNLLTKFTPIESNIEGLYFFGFSKKNALGRFKNLRNLMMLANRNDVIPLADCPNLEQLYISYVCDKCFDTFHDAVLNFVGHSTKLKKLYFHNNLISFEKFKFTKLNEARETQSIAGKLKIYVESKEDEDTGKLDDIQQTFDAIEIVRPNDELINDTIYTFIRPLGPILIRNKADSFIKHGIQHIIENVNNGEVGSDRMSFRMNLNF